MKKILGFELHRELVAALGRVYFAYPLPMGKYKK